MSPPYAPSSYRDRWVTIWRNIATMQDLRELRVELAVSPHWTDSEVEKSVAVLQPINNVTVPA